MIPAKPRSEGLGQYGGMHCPHSRADAPQHRPRRSSMEGRS